MGRVTDWIVSSFQSCISCVSGNDGDARPTKAKKRKPRKFRLMKSAAVSPHQDCPKDKTATTAGEFPCTKGRPLPKPFSSGCKRNKVEPAKANKKSKGAHPCKCCVNAQHDPYKIKLRLSSKLQKHKADEHVCTTAGEKDMVMKKIDQEVREKVDKMFGKPETDKKSRKAARKTKKNGLKAEPMESRTVPGHVRTENQSRRKNVTEDTVQVASTDSVSKKDKMSRSAVTAGNNTDGYFSHDDDDDIVIGKPTHVRYSYKVNYSATVYPHYHHDDDDDDDDDDIVFGKSTPVPNSYKLNYSIPVYPDDHDDDDDIVIGNSTPMPCSVKQQCSEPSKVDDDYDDDDYIVMGNSTPVSCSAKQQCSEPSNVDDDYDDDDDIVIGK